MDGDREIDPPVDTKRSERNDLICEAFQRGATAEKVGQQFGLSTVTVRKILGERGIKRGRAGRPLGKMTKDFDVAISDTHYTVGKRLVTFLHMEKIRSVAQCSEEIGWSPQKVASICKGTFNLSLQDIEQLAKYMERSMSKLLEGL